MSRFTFTELKNGDVIEQCGGMLANRMRCSRAAEFEVVDSQTKTPYQVCKRHKLILESEDLNQTEKQTEKKPEPAKIENKEKEVNNVQPVSNIPAKPAVPPITK